MFQYVILLVHVLVLINTDNMHGDEIKSFVSVVCCQAGGPCDELTTRPE